MRNIISEPIYCVSMIASKGQRKTKKTSRICAPYITGTSQIRNTNVLNSTSLNAITDGQFIITHRAVKLARTAKKQRIGNVAAGLGNFSSLPRPDWLWGPPSLPHPVAAGVELPRFKADSPRYLLPRLRTCGST
jgi:hypothetical protein